MTRPAKDAPAPVAPLPRELFGQVVRLAPLVSLDLVLWDARGRVLLGRRLNAPARGTWFVPGGCVRKGEPLADALARVSQAELGRALRPQDVTLLGVYEHLYEDNALGLPGCGTHYVVLACEAHLGDGEVRVDATQHGAHRFLSPAELLADPQVHPNTKAYFAPRPQGWLACRAGHAPARGTS